MSKNINNVKKAKTLIKHYLNCGCTDNIVMTKKIKKAGTGLTSGEVTRLVNKYTEEVLLEQGYIS